MTKLATVLIITAFLFPLSAMMRNIVSITTDAVPKIENRRMSSSMTISFDNNPGKHWIYYDEKEEILIVDFYDISFDTIAEEPPVNNAFGELNIRNLETGMSMTGKRAQITIATKPGWHFASNVRDSSSIELTAWRNVRRNVADEKKMWPRIIGYSLIPVAAGVTVFFVAKPR